jgi:hypothetical protein
MKKSMLAAILAASAILVVPGAGRVRAAVSEQEAQKLKTTLTPLGGERAGNAEGSIPAWDGGYSKIPAGYVSGDPRPDPFAEEKPLYTVTPANLSQYRDKLSEGEIELLKRYPDYKINVYPTHRTAAAPDFVYENTLKNAIRAKTANGGLTVSGAFGGIPFPIPHDGFEAMWNHLLAWKGAVYSENGTTYLDTADGRLVLLNKSTSQGEYPYYSKDGSPETFGGIYLRQVVIGTDPPNQAGTATILYNPIDPYRDGQPAWQYLPGQRRVRKAPSLAYDTPNFFNSGVGQMDDFDVFYGALDRYDFKLIGKKEMIVPYNSNRVRLVPPKQLFKGHTLNPDSFRWELHRVWVVEASLAQGKRNAVAKRKFYLDEDTWQALIGEEWDGSGALWRHIVGLPLLVFDAPAVALWGTYTYDFHTGIVAAIAMSDPSLKPSYQILPKPYPPEFFTPDGIAARMAR